MDHNDTLLALTRANAQLQVNITQLLQKSSQGWLETMQHFSRAGLAETDAQAEELLGAGDWAALMALPSAMLSRSSPAWGKAMICTSHRSRCACAAAWTAWNRSSPQSTSIWA